VRGRYFGPEGKAVHARIWHEGKSHRPLICLPPAPHTGLYFKTFASHIDETLIGVDYPGMGASDRLAHKPSIADFAKSLSSVINAYGAVHILGFHTGCLVALEVIQVFGNSLGEIILIDGPFFDQDTRAKYAPAFPDVQPPNAPEDLSKSFESTVTNRRDKIGESRALELWVESLRAGPRYNDPFQEAYSYDVEAAVAACKRPVHVIATQSGLLGVAQQAGQRLNASYREVLEIKSDVFETGAPIMAPIIKSIIS